MTSKLLQTDFCGIPMASPIVLLSGCVGFGEEYTRVEGYSNADVGAVVLKGTTAPTSTFEYPSMRVYSSPKPTQPESNTMGDTIGIPQNSVCKGLSAIGARFYISCGARGVCPHV